MSENKTEDQVRDDAKATLQFDKPEEGVKQGTGQTTTFNNLGFPGSKCKPDGWYLPKNTNEVAIILETKSSDKDISRRSYIEALLKYIDVISEKYTKTIGILYNGNDVAVYKNKNPITTANNLQPKQYYIDLFKENTIDKNKIYTLTKKINDLLHFKFGVQNLYHRMIFTASALVVECFGGNLEDIKDNGYELLKTKISNFLNSLPPAHKKKELKIKTILEIFEEIKMDMVEDKEPSVKSSVNSFIDSIIEISHYVNSDKWNGEDVMGIFFNEFNRYKKKSENGQVFTPEHIASFMYKLIGVNSHDKVLDATCGSGIFLVKSMANMIIEVGIGTEAAKKIKENNLYGIELSREIFALACANMLIHKDGITNLERLDSRKQEACEWIKSKNITKVLMNPPFERKYGCKKIVENVLNNVSSNIQCAFILQDKKLEKDKMQNLLKKHTLEMIIKLPENLFDASATTSIFVFKTGIPQGNKQIFACYIEDDGLERVKNEGRHDIKGKWSDIEKYWLDVVKNKEDSKYKTDQLLNPNENLSYQKPKKDFEIFEEDFKKTVLDFILFEKRINVKEFNEKLLNAALYKSKIENDTLTIKLGVKDE